MEKNITREIAIEIFPAEKSCAQECPPCPMAKKGLEVTATEIDSEVQKSFTLIEWVLKKCGENYDMHFAHLIKEKAWLFPTLRYPKIINMARFETDRGIRLSGGVEDFSNQLKALLLSYNIDPIKVGFSIVPKKPLVSDADMKIVEELFSSIKSWFFDQKSRSIEVTIRSNLIAFQLFKEILPLSFENDEANIRPLMEKLTGDSGVLFNNHNDHPEGKFPYMDNLYTHENSYTVRDLQNEIRVFNRVITVEKSQDTVETHKQQSSFAKVLASKKLIADFAIAPRGVMLMHSSFSINNPILWITHNDFRRELLRRRWKKDFCPFHFLFQMIVENETMYSVLQKNLSTSLKFDEWRSVFEKYRPQIVKFRKKAKLRKRQQKKRAKKLLVIQKPPV